LAKREEEIFVLGRSESLRLPRRSPALRVLQQARDEAHRFAVTFQRKRRSLRTVTSELLRIPGIGESKRRQLLQAFGSLQGVRESGDARATVCPACGQPFLVRYDSLTPARQSVTGRWDMWRYGAVMPLKDGEAPVSLGEGLTPMQSLPGLARAIGIATLWVK